VALGHGYARAQEESLGIDASPRRALSFSDAVLSGLRICDARDIISPGLRGSGTFAPGPPFKNYHWKRIWPEPRSRVPPRFMTTFQTVGDFLVERAAPCVGRQKNVTQVPGTARFIQTATEISDGRQKSLQIDGSSLPRHYSGKSFQMRTPGMTTDLIAAQRAPSVEHILARYLASAISA
jgi:hypothetical protein